MSVIIEDDRYRLRTWEIEDAECAFAFYGDARVSRYIGNGTPSSSVAQMENMLRKFMDHQAQFGFCPWAIEEKASEPDAKDEVIGICGLHTYNAQGEAELGFRIRYSHWNRGIASATSRLAVEFGLNHLHQPKIIALTQTENLATQRVLEKIGFLRLGEESVDGRPVFRYEIRPSP